MREQNFKSLREEKHSPAVLYSADPHLRCGIKKKYFQKKIKLTTKRLFQKNEKRGGIASSNCVPKKNYKYVGKSR